MTAFIQIFVCLTIVMACVRPLGAYMARVYEGQPFMLKSILGGFEGWLYRICDTDPNVETGWRGYAAAIMLFSLCNFFLLFVLLMMQGHLPLNPQNLPGLPAHLAFNVAVSFLTNTNWQSYVPEATMSYLSQMAGLAVQNFVSAAVGMAVAVALFRAISRKKSATLGNPWVDIVRSILYILLPLSFVAALLLASQGVVQNFSAYTEYQPLNGSDAGYIAQGPAASQVAIKMLGSNGGGFFNANGAHPFENPTPFSNLFQIMAILLIPASLVYTFGVMVADRRQSWMLLSAMLTIFLPLLVLATLAEKHGNPRFDAAVIDQPQGNMEGKETRIGVEASAFWAVATTATSNGSVNSMHDSFTPLGGMVPLLFIQFGEVIFGGVGTGAYGMLIYVLLTVFIGGLMVGRTPEYLGKKLGPYEIKMSSLCILIPAAVLLVGTAVAVSAEVGRAAVHNPGAQGFTEILYAVSSAGNNNGSAFAGLSTNSPFYNILLAICMLLGRFGVILPVLAIAGSIAQKNIVPASPGTLPTHTPLFTVMLVCSILLLDVLTYVPVLALGPVAEHLHLFRIDGAS